MKSHLGPAHTELSVDDIARKFGNTVKYEPALPALILKAVEKRLVTILNKAAISAVIRSRT